MALINQNSIIGVTSITSPSASNVLTVHTNDTTERLRVTADGVSFSGTNASLDTSGNISAVDGTFSGNVSIGGTLTYEDVTNIDSIGIVTARNGLNVTGGNVGIGTDNPTSDLQVVSYAGHGKIRVESAGDGNRAGIEFFRESSAGTGKGAAGIWVESETGNSTGELRFGTANNSSLQSFTTKMILDVNGRLGIGTNVPDASFHIHDNTSASFDAICLSGSPKRQNLIKVNGADNLIVSVDEDNEGNDSNFRLQIDGSEKIRVRSSGRVGINTTEPGALLAVAAPGSSAQIELKRTNTNTAGAIGALNFTAIDGHSVANIYALGDGDNEGAHLVFKTTSDAAESNPYGTGTLERARILSSGGITFNGDTAQANALNDYEEGTLDWRLQRTGSIGSGSNHGDTSITYTKIGNRVYVSGYLYTANTGNSTGVTVELRDNSNVNNVATLPYVPNQAGGFSITGTRTISDNYRNMAVTFRHGQAQVYIYKDDGDNDYLKNENNVQINSSQTHLVIQFCGSYTTNS